MVSRRKIKATPGNIDQHEQMLEVLAQFRGVFKTVRRHYQKVQLKTHVSGAQRWALAHIANAPGCTVGSLARELAIHQSTASNLLNPLSDLGLIVRRREAADQRMVSLNVTGEGKKVLKRAPRPLIGVLQQGLLELPGRELASLGELLESLIASMHLDDMSAGSMPLSDI